jgi:hypothetical protein
MPLKTVERPTKFRSRVLTRYAAALLQQPDAVVDFLCGQLLVVTRHLEQSARIAISERVRDCADAIEREEV